MVIEVWNREKVILAVGDYRFGRSRQMEKGGISNEITAVWQARTTRAIPGCTAQKKQEEWRNRFGNYQTGIPCPPLKLNLFFVHSVSIFAPSATMTEKSTVCGPRRFSLQND
jgi:hypothetical protein